MFRACVAVRPGFGLPERAKDMVTGQGSNRRTDLPSSHPAFTASQISSYNRVATAASHSSRRSILIGVRGEPIAAMVSTIPASAT